MKGPTYVERPQWQGNMGVLDGETKFDEREFKALKSENEETVSELENLSDILAVDEDGYTDPRAERRFQQTIKSTEKAFAETNDYAKNVTENLLEAYERIEWLEDTLASLLSNLGAVAIEDDPQELVLDWAKKNLRGDWEYFTYVQKKWSTPHTIRIFTFTDDVDRLNFKMRWG